MGGATGFFIQLPSEKYRCSECGSAAGGLQNSRQARNCKTNPEGIINYRGGVRVEVGSQGRRTRKNIEKYGKVGNHRLVVAWT